MNSSSSSRGDKFKFMRNQNSNDLDPSQRANTTNEPSIYKTVANYQRSDLGTASIFNGSSAIYKNREAISTRGGLSLGSRQDLDSQFEPPFLILPDQESLSHFMTKQRKMVSSVSSKYLNYNPAGASAKNIGDGLSTINGERDGSSPHKIGNFNEYQHIYTDSKSNEANVNWITKLRESENSANLMSSSRINGTARNENNDKSSLGHIESFPPSVYFKGSSENFVKRVTDYQYKGNHLDVSHLTRHRLGPTPNIGQVTFETSLRKYMSQKDLKLSSQNGNTTLSNNRTSLNPNENERNQNSDTKRKSQESSLDREEKDFVTIFPKSKSILSQYAPSFLPPISNQARKQLDQLDVIMENTKTMVKGLHKKPEQLQLISSFDGFHKSMPKFKDKVEDAANYNQIRHLMKGNKKMSEVLWELSLRPDAYKKNDQDLDNRRKFTAFSKIQGTTLDGLKNSAISGNRSSIQYFSEPRRKQKNEKHKNNEQDQ